ncbi:MAG: hypothetical protein HY815_13225 [Candidatus Riflebacteria bacterium]|nr:hypothetical protein [Candidatus Riflebacteria bacterium]
MMGRFSNELERMGKHLRESRDSREIAVKRLRDEACAMISVARSTRQRTAAEQRAELSSGQAKRSRATAAFLSTAREERLRNAAERLQESRRTLQQRRRSVEKTLHDARLFTRDVSRRLAKESAIQKQNLAGFVGGLEAAVDETMSRCRRARSAFAADYQKGARLMREALDHEPAERDRCPGPKVVAPPGPKAARSAPPTPPPPHRAVEPPRPAMRATPDAGKCDAPKPTSPTIRPVEDEPRGKARKSKKSGKRR